MPTLITAKEIHTFCRSLEVSQNFGKSTLEFLEDQRFSMTLRLHVALAFGGLTDTMIMQYNLACLERLRRSSNVEKLSPLSFSFYMDLRRAVERGIEPKLQELKLGHLAYYYSKNFDSPLEHILFFCLSISTDNAIIVSQLEGNLSDQIFSLKKILKGDPTYLWSRPF